MNSPALVSITFDDGFRCQFDKAVPILNRHGFPATFFLIANQELTHDRWSRQHDTDWWKIDWREDDIVMLKELVQNGHEIGSHSVTHNPYVMQSQPEVEVRDSKRMIEDWIGMKVPSFCYPFYRSHSYLAHYVRSAGHEQARGGGGILNGYVPRASYYAIPDGSLDRFNVDCRQISTGENVAGWVRPACWHVLTYHGIGDERDGWAAITVNEFTRQMDELAKHRDSGDVEVVTFRDGASRFPRK